MAKRGPGSVLAMTTKKCASTWNGYECSLDAGHICPHEADDEFEGEVQAQWYESGKGKEY